MEGRGYCLCPGREIAAGNVQLLRNLIPQGELTDFAARGFRATECSVAEVIAAGARLVVAARDGADEFFKLTS